MDYAVLLWMLRNNIINGISHQESHISKSPSSTGSWVATMGAEWWSRSLNSFTVHCSRRIRIRSHMHSEILKKSSQSELFYPFSLVHGNWWYQLWCAKCDQNEDAVTQLSPSLIWFGWRLTLEMGLHAGWMSFRVMTVAPLEYTDFHHTAVPKLLLRNAKMFANLGVFAP